MGFGTVFLRQSGWPEPDYEDPVRRTTTPLVVAVTIAAVSTVFTAIRVWTRVYVSRWFGVDDVFVIVAMVFTIALNALFYLAATHYGYDRHSWDLQPDERARTGKIAFLHNIFFIMAANTTHISWMCFYYRISKDSGIQWFSNFLHISVAGIMGVFVLFLALILRLCFPIKALWAFPPVENAQCLQRQQITFAGAIIKTMIDTILVLLPIPLILNMTMKATQRVALLTLLTLGIIVTGAGGARIYYVYQMFYGSDDLVWNAFSAYYAGCVEHSVGVICACIPPLRPLFGPRIERLATIIGSLNGRRRNSDQSEHIRSTTFISGSKGEAKTLTERQPSVAPISPDETSTDKEIARVIDSVRNGS